MGTITMKYAVEVQQFEDESGDCFLEFPPVLLEGLGWKAGDDLKFIPKKNGSFSIKKVNLETIKLDFDDDELLKYMTLAHERGQSFNEFVEEALIEKINQVKFENECG